MRSIVLGFNSATKHLAKHLEDIGRKISTHIQNSTDLVDTLEQIELEDGEVLTLFDITALFTSVLEKEVGRWPSNVPRSTAHGPGGCW